MNGDLVVMPQNYIAAKMALATCERVDECQNFANKAAALASYARQSRDDSLVIMAQRIQARAIRKCGELLKLVPVGQRMATAEMAGVSRLQRNQAVSIAQIPTRQFEKLVESESPPRIYELATIGRKSSVKPKKNACATCPTCGKPI